MIKLMSFILAICFWLFGCGVKAEDISVKEAEADKLTVSKISEVYDKENSNENEELRGIWVSQFDMHYIYRDGNKQREEQDYRRLVNIMISNIKKDGFNTVFLQVRPNGDSMFESDIYPISRYIGGSYGGKIDYDAIKIYLEIAKAHDISVHAWINPFRLCYLNELEEYGQGILYQWLGEGIGKRIEKAPNDILYLDPSYEDATQLIVKGAKEILEKYNFDGIHIDDYFYPTDFEIDDEAEFENSNYISKSEFRKEAINRTVTALYDVVHSFENKVFGISPAGNINALSAGWYVDIYKWLSMDGFCDYIMPQLYFGFENQACPFDQIIISWEEALKTENTKLYIGLSASKCVNGSQGIEDYYAGENGKHEWRDNKDILKRSYEVITKSEKAEGFCIFTYSSFYDSLTGEDNPLCKEEKDAFCMAVLENN